MKGGGAAAERAPTRNARAVEQARRREEEPAAERWRQATPAALGAGAAPVGAGSVRGDSLADRLGNAGIQRLLRQAHPRSDAATAPRPAAPPIRRAAEPDAEVADEDDERDENGVLLRSAIAGDAGGDQGAARSAAAGPGEPLADPLRADMERGFGASFAGVRVHRDAAGAAGARAIAARAYTIGEHVVFGAGRYAPEEPAGRRLLAHELAHVVQQRGDGSGESGGLRRDDGVSHPEDACEREAEAAADAVMSGRRPAISAGGAGIMRDEDDGERSVWDDVVDVAKEAGKGIAEHAPALIPGLAPAKAIADMLPGPTPEQIAERDRLLAQLGALSAQAMALAGRVAMARVLHVSDALWGVTTGALTRLQGVLAALPVEVPGLGAAIAAFLGAAQPTGSVVIAAAPAVALPIAVGGAAIGIGALIIEALWITGLFVLALMLLYLAYLALQAVVQAIIDIIEAMRPQPPIFWPAMMLPVPGPIGMPIVRTKPRNPRIPGGGGDVVRATIPPALRTVLVARHVLPLFLGGTDVVGNVVVWPRLQHVAGHPMLQVQPQMAVWGYPVSLYAHPPPAGYFLAGYK